MKWKKRYFLLLLLPMALLLSELAKRSVWFTEEVFAKRIYRVLQVPVSFVTGILPFSLAELIVVTSPAVILFFLVRFVIHMVKRKKERFFLCLEGILNVGCVAAVIFFVYVVGCGMNYHRVSITEYCGLTVQESSKEELFSLCMEMADEAKVLRQELSVYEDENGALELPMSNRKLAKLCRDAYYELAKELPVLGGYCAPPKSIFFSRQYSAMELTGVFTCWTMEANVNVDISDYAKPYTMAHELGHVHGFMREEEANFLSYLACRASDSPFVRYSGLMLGLVYCGNALAGQDVELYGQLWQNYDVGMAIDFQQNSLYWAQFEDTVISRTADKVNDTYLKANEQEDGVKSYGRVVDLLLADYRKRCEDGRTQAQ